MTEDAVPMRTAASSASDASLSLACVNTKAKLPLKESLPR